MLDEWAEHTPAFLVCQNEKKKKGNNKINATSPASPRNAQLLFRWPRKHLCNPRTARTVSEAAEASASVAWMPWNYPITRLFGIFSLSQTDCSCIFFLNVTQKQWTVLCIFETPVCNHIAFHETSWKLVSRNYLASQKQYR